MPPVQKPARPVESKLGGFTFRARFYEPGCQSHIDQVLDGDLFELAGDNKTMELSQQLVLGGDNLVEISSDATAHYYLRVELQ